ncbi:purine-nucleoside phosphorylase [candidate division KSB1 bacterium]|nr:purine-nucleoside phosphorylase [candidate division KSB1 bacterium]
MTTLLQQIDQAVAVIRKHAKTKPEIGIILGTGLGALAKEIKTEATISYSDLPHFPLSTVESHAGRLIFGTLGNKQVVAMQGRFHFYEGYSMKQITFPVRVMKALGCHTLVVSNACGGMNPLFAPGDIMIMTDHINLLGDNPLIGPNEEALGPRFPDMSEPYTQALIALAEQVALEEKIRVQKGVYVALSGPNLETRAEYRFLRQIGADVVGMSTVPEVIAAVHGGMKVLGLSVVTDSCLPDALEPVDIAKIIKTAGEAEPKLTLIMKRVIERM